ncbi:zinc carboxypeptidase A 1-like [Bicyclus anynana]|uniref:Zinc carboxypeptidase A 1-like n=1 Tax=Bicyclus anynana TaxID=110368 RepID=A0A6J1P9J7_BICAN|nr:zinc carboxypeptidase A 1-like [Bicyclus anynana]
MLKTLLQPDEDPCIENVAIGASTVTILLKALSEFCGSVIKVYSDKTTYEGRNLYEVVINSSQAKNSNTEDKPVILLEAGQDGGTGPIALALYIIEQLVACGEHKHMIQKVRWVILPSTNPDGQEYARTKREPWKKNFSPNGKDVTANGVDITRNFDDSWGQCPPIILNNAFSQDYSGPKAGSETETSFVTDIFAKYRTKIRTYVSIRRDGHALLYPLATRNVSIPSIDQVSKRAGQIAAKVNQRAGGIQWFLNQSIFVMNGKAHCGHSVDLAYNKYGIKYAFEMRVFPETDNRIMSKFQSLPKGHEVSLRTGYFSGIRELFNLVVNDKNVSPHP